MTYEEFQVQILAMRAAAASADEIRRSLKCDVASCRYMMAHLHTADGTIHFEDGSSVDPKTQRLDELERRVAALESRLDNGNYSGRE